MTQAAASASLACERLARSRERLRQALLANTPAPTADTASLDWLDGLKGLPGFDVVLAAVRVWWSQQPLRQTELHLADVAKEALLPLAQRAPLRLALVAAMAGGLLVWLRPWRWLPAAALLGAVTPRVLGTMLTHLPLEAWLAGLSAYLQRPARAQPPRQDKPSEAHAP